MTEPRRLKRIIRLKDSEKYTGHKPAAVPQLIEDGKLPPLRQLTDGGRARGWFEDDLIDHQERIAAWPHVVPKKAEKAKRVERIRRTG